MTFTDVAAAAGLTTPSVYGGLEKKTFIIETNGCGVAFFDFDNDGWTDVFLLNGRRLEDPKRGQAPTSRLYRNERNGRFADVTEASGLARTGWASGVCVGDVDNDGFPDLFVTYWGQNVLYRNLGNGSFADVTKRAGVATSGIRWGSGCTFVDYDRDGYLDLFVANYLSFDLATAKKPGDGANCMWKGVAVNCGPKGLPTDTNLLYHNNGDGTFADVSAASGIAKVTGRYAMTASTTDFNDDGWPDIYVACDSTASILLRNNKNGTFTDVATESGCAFNEDGQVQAGMGVATGDFNADGRIDLFKTHFSDDLPALYRNTGKNYFEDASRASGFEITRFVQWGVVGADFDDDGWVDLMVMTGSVYPEVEKVFKDYPYRGPRLVYRNDGKGRFDDVTDQAGAAVRLPLSSRGCACGDFDNDGDVDVLIMNMNDLPQLLRNDLASSPSTNWLSLRLVGTKSNRSAIGARVRVTCGDHVQTQELTSQSSYYSSNDPRMHFGLGSSEKIDRVEIRWPSGATETIANVVPNRFQVVAEGTGLAKPDTIAPARR